MSSSFSSLSFDTTTKATATDAAPANDAEAPSKDSSKEDAADATAVADGLVNSLAAAANGGEEGGSQGKAVAGFRYTDPIIQPIVLIQDNVKQEKNKRKESELVYSSFSAEKEEYASVLRSSFSSSSSTSLNILLT